MAVNNSKEARARDRAEAQFQKAAVALKEGQKAKAQYVAAGQAERDKTARLRALRLAKEATETPPAESTPTKDNPAKSPGRKPA